MTSGRPQVGDGPVWPSPGSTARLRPIGGGGFHLRTGHWADRRRRVRDTGLAHAWRQLEAAGSVDNLRRLTGVTNEPYRGPVYSDSDVYKVMEASAWSLARADSPETDHTLVELTALLAKVQADDGYLNSWFQSPESPDRYSDLPMGHELYCAGHLIQAAIARQRATGATDLIALAGRFADHLVEMFADRPAICGHPLIESALVELYRTTGETRYLHLASDMIDRRGHGLLGPGPFGARYYQDDVAIRDADGLNGHCVRALYLAGGATDVYLENGDATLLAALERQWDDTVATKTYLTGGMGCRRKDEAFGARYELPPDHAFAETCAAVAAVGWSWRLLLATGRARYADLIERLLFNVVSASMSLDGERFFYINTLHRRPDSPESGDKVTRRQPWFRCACCPPNLMRLLASLGHYFATTDADGVQVHQYADGTVRAPIDGAVLTLNVRTEYPRSGTVRITIVEEPGQPCAIALRQPGWCETASLALNGERLTVEPRDGYLVARRRWQVGDELTLELTMPVRVITPDRRIDAVRGCVAVERGPVVYCLEQADLEGVALADVTVDLDGPAELTTVAGLDDTLVGIRMRSRLLVAAPPSWPYRSGPRATREPGPSGELTLVPYYAWGNRTDGPMRVWLPIASSTGDPGGVAPR